MEIRYKCRRCGREGEGDSQTFEDCAEEDILPMTLETQGQDALEALKDVAEHAKDCVRNGFRSGRATANGGYECYYQTVDGAKWFQAKPIDETPKCDCGLDFAIAALEKERALSEERRIALVIYQKSDEYISQADKELTALRAEVQAVEEEMRANGSHWRQPYQAFCYDMADRLRKARMGE